jgi:circadian clock protein KaiB
MSSSTRGRRWRIAARTLSGQDTASTIIDMAPPDTACQQLERALTRSITRCYVLRLYVSGASLRSLDAIRNIRHLCDARIPHRYELEVVDIYQQADRAARDQVVATPMLVKRLPLPPRRVIGTLANTGQLLHILGLTTPDTDRAQADRG